MTMPLKATDVRKLIRRLLDEGKFVPPGTRSHARKEMEKDGLTDRGCGERVARRAWCATASSRTGRGGTELETQRMVFVVAFDPEPETMPTDDEDLGELELVLVSRVAPVALKRRRRSRTMGKKCRTCGKAELTSSVETYLYAESGLPNVTLVGVEVRRCPSCGDHELVLPRVTNLHRAIAHAVIHEEGSLERCRGSLPSEVPRWSGGRFS